MPRLVPPAVLADSITDRDQPTLDVAPDVHLRPWRADDRDAVMAAFADADIQHWHDRRIDSPAEADGWINDTWTAWSTATEASWAIADPSDATVLGRVALHFRYLPSGTGEIAYWVLPGARGRGLAARATDSVAEWAFADLGMHRLEIEHSTRNPTSCRVAQRAGFALEGTRRHALRHADGWHDMHVHGRIVSSPGDEPEGAPVPSPQ